LYVHYYVLCIKSFGRWSLQICYRPVYPESRIYRTRTIHRSNGNYLKMPIVTLSTVWTIFFSKYIRILDIAAVHRFWYNFASSICIQYVRFTMETWITEFLSWQKNTKKFTYSALLFSGLAMYLFLFKPESMSIANEFFHCWIIFFFVFNLF
jgi:hypothetical protein